MKMNSRSMVKKKLELTNWLTAARTKVNRMTLVLTKMVCPQIVSATWYPPAGFPLIAQSG
ncbi:MAG TPA: hypothetical protein VGT03_04935 [Candidatus Acidoferrales bacterium]|nr:hypothetical protein [Candidatus Acidoferrales bacterium]